MPFYEYIVTPPAKGCDYCHDGFERLQPISADPLVKCPKCGDAIKKCISRINVGASQSCLDDRAKNQGFTKLKRVSKGEYEKQF